MLVGEFMISPILPFLLCQTIEGTKCGMWQKWQKWQKLFGVGKTSMKWDKNESPIWSPHPVVVVNKAKRLILPPY